MKENQGTPRPHQIVAIPCLIAKRISSTLLRSPFTSIIWYLWNSTVRARDIGRVPREKRFEVLYKRRILFTPLKRAIISDTS
jgi:hypothetical protein